LFPDVPTSLEPDELVLHTKKLLSLTDKEAEVIKEENKHDILTNHCYVNRIQKLMNL